MTTTTPYSWRIEAGERAEISFNVLDAADTEVDVEGWTIDAKIRTRPGGTVLYTVPVDHASIDSSGTVTLTIPAPVSAAWAWTTGWWRAVITDPNSPADDPQSQRVIAGPFVVDPD